MRALVLSALLLAGLASKAPAQLAFGPITIENNVNGVPITVGATSWITVKSVDNDIMVDARIFADLIDLQKKFLNVGSTFKFSENNCATRGVDNPNPIVSLKKSSLWPRGDHLVMSVRGHVDIWSCVAGPPKSEIQWQKKKVGFIKIKVPVVYTRTNLKANKDGTHPFNASLPIYLVKKDSATVALEIAEPNVKLEDQDVIVKNAILKLANADISQTAYNALQSAIDPAKLKEVLPIELQKLSMSVVSARFRDDGGHAVAEINLAARVPRNAITQLLQQIAASPENRIERADPVLYSLR